MAKKQRSREKLDILADIIRLCSEATRKTHVIYGANLSTLQADKYLQQLVEQRLIEEVTIDGNNYYEATVRGRLFVELQEKVREMLDSGPLAKGIRQHRVAHEQKSQ